MKAAPPGGKTRGEDTHMRTYGIGIIGWGFMGRTHALAIRTLPLFYEGRGLPRRDPLHLHAPRGSRAAGRAGYGRGLDVRLPRTA